MRLAIVHDASAPVGGAERVVAALRATFPDAPVFAVDPHARDPADTASFIRRFPRWFRRRKLHTFLLPVAAETFDLSAFDVVLSSCATVAKGIVTRPGTTHISYTHAPSRVLWDATHDAAGRAPPRTLRRALLRFLLHQLRLWDVAAARRVDLFLANSRTTRDRIRKYYGRDSLVVPPPLTLTPAHPPLSMNARQHFLFVGRLTPSKRWLLAVETFLKLGLPLVVVGDGHGGRELRRRARPPISVRGPVTDATLSALYRTARAVIFPSDDDYGLVPIEAMAHGTPVIALRRGGATETVTEGVTGELFDEPAEEFLADCVRRFLLREPAYDPLQIQQAVAPYALSRFQEQIRKIVYSACKQRQEYERR